MLEINSEEWKTALQDVMTCAEVSELQDKLTKELSNDMEILPARAQWFRALEMTQPSVTKLVMLGQDPYPSRNHANGLAFSVSHGVRIPQSLRNIFTELGTDLGFTTPDSGDLSPWAQQGVLLLNSCLTVQEGIPASHKDLGWGTITDQVIRHISDSQETVVFILWGLHAQKKANLIDTRKHLILSSAHPSPLSARRGFFGSKPFSKANRYLIENGVEPVNWQLPVTQDSLF